MNEELVNAKRCPLCGENNRCGNEAGLPLGECWCAKVEFSREIFDLVPAEKLNRACICRTCAEKAGKP